MEGNPDPTSYELTGLTTWRTLKPVALRSAALVVPWFTRLKYDSERRNPAYLKYYMFGSLFHTLCIVVLPL